MIQMTHTSCLIDFKDSGISGVTRLIQTVIEEPSLNILLKIVAFCRFWEFEKGRSSWLRLMVTL